MYIKRVLNSSLKHFQTLRKTDKNLITFVVTELILKNSFEGIFFFYQTLAYIEQVITLEQASKWKILFFYVSNLNL